MRTGIWSFGLIGCLAAVAILTAETRSSPGSQDRQQPIFRGVTDIVRLAVRVLDDRRRPVRGLEIADFTVRVDGRPQPIAAVAEVTAPIPDEHGAVWMRETGSDVVSNTLREPRLLVLILDDATLPADAFALNHTRKIAHALIDRLGPMDLASVVFTWDNRPAQDFTNDREKLRAAVDRFFPGPPTSREAGNRVARGYSPNALRRAMQYLAAYPDLQKVVFFISGGGGGAPRDFFDPDESWGQREGIGMWDPELDLRNEARTFGGHGQLSHVPVIGISPLGLCAPTSAGVRINCGGGRLRFIAKRTDGRAVVDTNDVLKEPGIEPLFEEIDSWYIVGFRPTYPLNDGRLRRFEIRARGGAMVFPSERTFRSPGRDDPEPERAPVPPSTRALAGLLPISDIPLRVTLVPVARRDPERGGRLTGSVAIVLGAPPEASDPPVPKETIDVEIRAFDPEGRKQVDVVTRRVEWNWRAGRRAYDILDAMDLAPGRYSLRFGVHDVERRRIGSVYADVTVPDFETAPLSLSGVALGLEAGPLAVAPESIAELLPIVPTTQRAFAPADRVTAFVRVHQGGGFLRSFQPITVTARIRDAQDAVVFDEAQRLTPRAFNVATRGADVTWRLPLERLTPGEYLLTLHAELEGTPESTVERKVRFSVTPGG